MHSGNLAGGVGGGPLPAATLVAAAVNAATQAGATSGGVGGAGGLVGSIVGNSGAAPGGMASGLGVPLPIGVMQQGVGLQLAAQPAAPPVTPRRMCRCGATNHARSSSKLCPFFGTGLQSSTKNATPGKPSTPGGSPVATTSILSSPQQMGGMNVGMQAPPMTSPPTIIGASNPMTGQLTSILPLQSGGLTMGPGPTGVLPSLTGVVTPLTTATLPGAGASSSPSSTSSITSSLSASATPAASAVAAAQAAAAAAAAAAAVAAAATSINSSSSSSTTSSTTPSNQSSSSSSTTNSKGKKRRFPRTYQAEEVARDARGKPIMPIRISPQSEGGLTIRSLGKVDERKGWHSSRYIWPLGFKTERLYPSMVVTGTRVKYTCEIIDRENKPWFQLTAWDAKDKPVGDITPSGAWSRVLGFVRALNNKPQEFIDENGRRVTKPVTLGSRVSGAHKFGFSMPTVARLIQELPGADKLTGYPAYKVKNFVVSNPSYSTPVGSTGGSSGSGDQSPGGSGGSSGGKKRHKQEASSNSNTGGGPGPMSVGASSPAVITAAASAVAAAAQRAAEGGIMHHPSLSPNLPMGPTIVGQSQLQQAGSGPLTGAPAAVPAPSGNAPILAQPGQAGVGGAQGQGQGQGGQLVMPGLPLRPPLPVAGVRPSITSQQQNEQPILPLQGGQQSSQQQQANGEPLPTPAGIPGLPHLPSLGAQQR
jgi:hypothetical protein